MKHIISLLLLLLLALPCTAQDRAISAAQLAALGALPVLHEGRLKPIDSFARILYRSVTERETAHGQESLEWLAEILFTPAQAAQRAQFPVRNPDVVRRLALPERKDKHYSFQELVMAMLKQKELITRLLQTETSKLATDEKALRQLYAAVEDFRQVSGALALVLPITMPLEPMARDRLGLAADAPVTFLELRRLQPAVMEDLQKTLATKQDDIASYSEAEQRNAHLSYQLSLLQSVGENNDLFRVIPPQWGAAQNAAALWYAPWDIVQRSLAGPITQRFLTTWGGLARAWQQDDAVAWQENLRTLRELNNQAAPTEPRAWAMTLELMLNHIAPFDSALWLILGGFVFLVLASWRFTHLSGAIAAGLMGAALLLQGCGILARMLILARPPVSTLYESTLFVSFLALACGLWLSQRRANHDGMAIGGAIAALLLMASKVFGADGDTLLVLVAVLDTNFWLATHVVCITAGYAATLVGGMMAHLLLLQRVRHPQENFAPQLARLHKTALFALLFTAVGTMLGGVWADQSWGRFWGWDPKENGALWIVLWLIWLLHGRIAGQIGSLGFAVGMALANIIVALAWFGVNLLNVGLHSYGFTDSAALGLGLFCIGELVLIGGLTAAYFMRQKRLENHAA